MKNSKGLFIKREKIKVPRKLKKKIPRKTHYCYTPTSGFKKFKDGTYGFSIKNCYFWKQIKYKEMPVMPSWIDNDFLEEYKDEKTGWCSLVKTIVDDQCKNCGIGY